MGSCVSVSGVKVKPAESLPPSSPAQFHSLAHTARPATMAVTESGTDWRPPRLAFTASVASPSQQTVPVETAAAPKPTAKNARPAARSSVSVAAQSALGTSDLPLYGTPKLHQTPARERDVRRALVFLEDVCQAGSESPDEFERPWTKMAERLRKRKAKARQRRYPVRQQEMVS